MSSRSTKHRQNLRRFIFLRDGERCRYCTRLLTLETMTLDHVVPKSKGGKSNRANVVASCWSCNHAKGDANPDAARGVRAVRVARKRMVAVVEEGGRLVWRDFAKVAR